MARAPKVCVAALTLLTINEFASAVHFEEDGSGVEVNTGHKQLMRRAIDEVGKKAMQDHAELHCNTGGDASPGTPRVAQYYQKLTHSDSATAALGDRLVQAANADDAVRSCGSFFAFGDYAWCNKAMPAESEFGKKNLFKGFVCNVSSPQEVSAIQQDEASQTKTALVLLHEDKARWREKMQDAADAKGKEIDQRYDPLVFDAKGMKVEGPQIISLLDQDRFPLSFELRLKQVEQQREENHGQFEALSFGIEETDPWSELMSSQYFLNTRLFDCYIESTKGPMFNDMHGNHSREKPCTDRGCYSVPYERNRICVDGTAKEVGGKKFLTLQDTLRGRESLSTHVKMDVEGSEWTVLEQLLNSEEDLDKIRTLDMELHLEYQLSGGMPLEKRVEIIEQLAKRYAVSGSTIQPLFRAMHEEFGREQTKNSSYAKNPPGIYNSAGMPLDQWCISFVNRKLL